MTDERSLWERATESSYWNDHDEGLPPQHPGPPAPPAPPAPGQPTWRPGEPMPNSGEPMPNACEPGQPAPPAPPMPPAPGQPTWRPGQPMPGAAQSAAQSAPPARSDFFRHDKMIFEHLGRTDFEIFDLEEQLIGRVERAKSLEDRGLFQPTVLKLTDAQRQPLLHIREYSHDGKASDASLPGAEGPLISIDGVPRFFRLSLAVRVHPDAAAPVPLFVDGNYSLDFVWIYPGTGWKKERDRPAKHLASVSRASKTWRKWMLLGRYQLSMSQELNDEVRLAMAATTIALAKIRYRRNQQ